MSSRKGSIVIWLTLASAASSCTIHLQSICNINWINAMFSFGMVGRPACCLSFTLYHLSRNADTHCAVVWCGRLLLHILPADLTNSPSHYIFMVFSFYPGGLLEPHKHDLRALCYDILILLACTCVSHWDAGVLIGWYTYHPCCYLQTGCHFTFYTWAAAL